MQARNEGPFPESLILRDVMAEASPVLLCGENWSRGGGGDHMPDATPTPASFCSCPETTRNLG